MFMRSSSPFWKARSRDWSSSMMLISMRPICGIFLPFISATMRASSGSVPALKSQVKPRIVRIRLEEDLRRADPFRELVRAGADRIRHDAAAFVAIGGDDFARDRARRLVREHVREVVVGLLQADAQRVAVDGLESRDLRVVVELAAVLLRLLGQFVEADDLAFEQPRPRRMDRRVHQPLQRVDVIVGDELALDALERRIGREVDALLDLERVGLAVVGDPAAALRQ